VGRNASRGGINRLSEAMFKGEEVDTMEDGHKMSKLMIKQAFHQAGRSTVKDDKLLARF
ncbi:hypothetical protein PIB30_047105, partial [Stylosanthes scabra]|nr:hypothetical protein [Stylosanthes scabra]